MTTGHVYYPMPDGTGITYQIFNVKCSLDGNGFGLSVLERTYSHLQRIAHSNTSVPNFFGYLPLHAGYQHFLDCEDTPINPAKTLTDGIAYAGGEYYLGEAENQNGIVHIPYIAKLAFNPYPGQTINQVSKIYKADTKTYLLDFHWTYKTLAHYDNWGAFPDVWRTALIEYNPMNEAAPFIAYNYCFMRNVGLVDLWYGQQQADGSIVGYEYYAVSY